MKTLVSSTCFKLFTSNLPSMTIFPMKTTRVPIALIAIIGMFALTGTPFAQQAPPAVLQEIQAIEDDWAKAFRTKDGSILSRILGEEYYEFSTDSGKRSTKREEVDGVKAIQATFSSVTNTVRDVRLYGEVAIALGQHHSTGTEGGQSFDRRYSWQTVFVKRGGRWVAVAAHVSEIPATRK